jgi:hypothetical protein
MNKSGQQIIIPLSKIKIIIMLLGALIFVVLGIWLVFYPPNTENSVWVTPFKMKLAGYASIIFFGTCAFFFIRKLPDDKPGLIIDYNGLTDNSSGFPAGQVLWSDIEKVSVIEISGQRIIMLKAKNPQDYIDRQTSLFVRKGMELNNRLYGTPLSLTANGLKISFDDLLAIVTKKFEGTRMKS